MYQRSLRTQGRRAGLTLMIGLFGAFKLLPAAAQDIGKCQRTIAKETAGFEAAVMKNLQKCEDGVLKGKIAACPDEKASSAIAASRAKLEAKITGACDGLTFIDMGFGGRQSECSSSCFIALDDAESVAGCVACIGEASVKQLIQVYYGAVDQPSTNKSILKCQQTLGKTAAKHFATVRKGLQKCEDGVLKGGAGPCPDSGTASKINASAGKVGDAVVKTCPDPVLSDAFNLGKFESRVSGVDPTCSAGVGSASAVAGSTTCVTEGNGDCTTDFSVGRALPCNPTGVCGNGIIEPGETCDDGNTENDTGVGPADFCPFDCQIGPCTAAGKRNVTVSFSSATPLLGMTIVLTYESTKVQIPGQSADAAVQARISSPSFSFTPNDLNYALRNVLLDPTFGGISSGPAFTVQFDTCEGSGSLSAADFSCKVAEASNVNLQPVTATCSVTVN
jgi:cysteine-rich repeat protein